MFISTLDNTLTFENVEELTKAQKANPTDSRFFTVEYVEKEEDETLDIP